ncbi:Putative Midasin [Rhizopus microsporus]|nr:Putative Midasin [Rhizopus microsporus]
MVEATEDNIFDPLSFDFLAAVQQLSAYVIEQEESALDAIIDLEVLKNPNSISRSDLLDLVSRAMINPSWTLAVVRLFRPIVIDLIGRWTMPGFTTLIETALSKTHTTVHTTELIAKAFSVILPIAPQVKNLAVLYFTHSTSLFERLDHYSNVDSMDISTSSSSIDNLHDLLLTTYRLLSFSAVTFSPIWNWGPVVQLLKYPDTCVRYITTLCLCKVYNLSDSQQNSLLSSIVGKPLDESDEPIYITIGGSRVDIRFLDLWEQQRLADNQIAYLTNNFDVQQRQLEDSDLCPSTCNLCGVLLTKRVEKESDRSSYNPELVLTKTTSKNLHAISLALSIGAPTLLEGVTGAGKTCLVEELAWRTGRGAELVKIHLGDQTDPKVLLGTYVSTSTPGSFRWQAGVLTTAVLEGRWVLIEDIDLAPAEVLSVLLPLLETGHLFIPSRGEKIKAKEGFQMFGTRSFLPSRSGKGVTSRGASMMTGANLWTRVHVEPLSHEELEQVIRQKFAHINDFASHAMNLFQTVVDLYEDTSLSLSSSSMGRFLSTRDLMKWCHRVDLLLGEKLNDSSEVGMDLTLRQDLFNEANDCFCGMIPDYNIWMTVLQTIGKPLQISQELVRNYVDQYKPVLDVNDTHVRIGRVNLSSIAASGKQKKKAGLIKREKQRPFATTGHALRLMEKIAVSIHLNEPVLLVGETGTGKTTVVQHLADMIHQNLIVVNLSQQSDSSDLLGGFKPVDGKVLAIPLNDEFERLFEKTFSVKKNIKFLDMVRKMFIHQKWTNFVALLKQAIKMSQQKFEAEQNVENKKTSSPQLRNAWKTFAKHVEEFEVQQVQSQNKFVFSFMEGSLVKAVRQGDWILLDEINLATTETLECLSGLLQDVNGSLLLTEKGDVEPIKRHPNFRLIPRQPAENYIQFGHFWLEQGQFPPEDDPRYILTKSIETKLYNLARVIMSRKFPVLIQGPTSAGKTSMVEYMAKKTGHRFVRINNHEHTDLQEYLGTYVSNNEGKLVFQEGVLVEALRNGYWIVLDELNLAPSDVLEALNRLLDDNRELLIPETQEILHFDDIPEDELETILSNRCRIAPSYCKKLVKVYKDLMAHRQSTRIFEQKHGFITLRDLFRWAGRDPQGYQELAENGYMLLAERCRRDEEKKVVKQVLEQVMKVKLDENEMYDCNRLEEFQKYDRLLKERSAKAGEDNKLVWTKAMRRLFSLVARCLRYDEPVLLVGDTGCGKTTVCQMLAETYGRELHIVNCHQNTETSDLLGGQRPVRGQDEDEDMDKPKHLFEWHDGPLVQSMKDGHLFLLDEISLADDSVLERLNSVLEPSRLLVLAEKGGKQVEELYAAPGFKFLATMNPGGDYGKKELSPALRNRFTEIWVPSVTDREDLISIIDEQMKHATLKGYSERMLDFISWYSQALGQSRTVISLRDILSWVKFMNTAVDFGLNPELSFAHGACIVLLDGLGSHGSSSSFMTGSTLKEFRLKCLRHLSGKPNATEQEVLGESRDTIVISNNKLAIGPFEIPRGKLSKANVKFTLSAPTTSDNAMRVVRAMQLRKPILLEGSPGVGKTSLISALAAASGHNLVRINLSEQTDLMDLFGSDLPVEGGNSGEFAWRDAPFLQAMKAGDWVLLDELNLASQSVLEGLNSCLDHRGAVYIPELDREFFCDKEFRVFGAQNPLQQGGGRKGLPKSFINRFTQVYVEQLSPEDLLFICSHLFPEFEHNMLAKMIEFNNKMYEETMIRCTFGRKGSPWEFNLRDVFRWLELMRQNHTSDPAEYLDIIYMQRMRSADDRIKVIQLFETAFDVKYDRPEHPLYEVTVDNFTVGHSRLARKQAAKMPDMFDRDNHILQAFLPSLQSLMKCVESGWMAILTGPSASGKTSLVRLLSKMTGNVLQEFAMNSSVDTMELLGGFEQVDLNRHRQAVMDMLHVSVSTASKSLLLYAATLPTDNENYNTALQLIRQLNDAMYVLNSKQQMKLASSDAESAKLDYALVSNVVSYLKSASAVDQELHNSISSLNAAVDNLQELEKDTVAGKFEWIDGLLINALEHGHWLLIDNANLCNPSVLDRLNPLFENDGVLMVNERGLVDGTVKVIKPHPNFRMFMTVDPQNGELSRAMRNRGIEIALLDSNWNKNDQDATKLVNALGIRGRRIPALLNELQGEVTQSRKHLAKSENVRDYLMFATYMAERLQRGQSLKNAIRDSFFQVFVDIENAPSALVALLENDIASQELLQELVSPTNSPFFIGGKLFQSDSNLAKIALHGAYFVYLLQTLDTDDEESQKKIDVAADYLLENLNLQNYGLCYRWLGYMSQHTIASKSVALEKIGYLMKNLIKHPLFTELTHVQLKSKSVAVNHEELTRVNQAYKMLIRLLKQDYIDNTMRSATQRLKIGNLTALQQSYCFQAGRLSESQLLHPVVPRLYPFFEAINSAVASWINQASYCNCTMQIFEAVHQVLDIRDYTWSLTHMEALSLDKLLISIRIMKELITTEEMASVGFNTVLNQIEDIMSGFDFDTSRSMMALWGHFHPSTLSSEPLHMLESDLRKISNDLNCYRFSLEEGLKPKSLVLHAKSEAKRTLIEGIATLYAVDVNNAATVEQTLKSLRNLPEYITRELQPIEANDTIRRDSSWDTALVPLHDHSSVLEEMEILAKLYFISCDRHESVNDKQLLEQMSKFKEYAINHSSRPPTDLVPYQRLIWFLDCGKSINTSLIPGLIQDAAYTYHQRLWRSSVFQKDLFQLVPNDTEKDLRITEGSLALYESVETFICLNMLGSVDKMPVDAFESALKQLKGLQQFLSNNTRLKDRRFLEVATLFSMTRQLLNASAGVLDEEAYEALSSVLNRVGEFSQRLLQSSLYFGNDVTSYYADVAAILGEASQIAQQYEFNTHYIGAIHALRATVESLANEDKRTFFSACGKARVLLGLAFLSAYIPDYPVDPTSEPRLRVDLLLQKKQKQLNNINVRENIEKIYTGNDTNSVIDEEKRSLEKLLAAQEQYHQNAAFKWWFHLYDTINNTSFDTESSESCKKTAHELLSALDQFMQTSSIAEYQPRLQMIDTFYQQAKLQAQFSTYESEQLSFEKTAVILRNVYLYYSQFQQHVDTMLTQMRKPIEKDLKDFVKIATWKDVNIYALRQSAVKTHRKLHKCICKYREVLNTSMLTVIANYNGEHAMYQYGDDKRYAKDINRGLIDQLSQHKLWISETSIKVTDTSFDWSAALPVKKHLANLPVTLDRLHLYCQKDVFINDAETNEVPLEDFMTEMISKVKQFQKETPAVLTDENKSTVMNQKQLKKKALVDFLKELRRLGLKSRATTMRESNSDSTALFLQNAAKLELLEATKNLQKLPLSICSGATQDIIEQWNKANDYYYRCVARLTHLRTISTTNVSRDLSMLEVERSMSAAEHMFLLVRKERHLFAQMENRIQILQGASVQLAALYDAFTNEKLIANGGDIEYRFTHHKAYVDKLALLMKQAVELVSIQASSATQGVLKDLQTACADVQKVQRTVDYWFVQRYLYPRSATSLHFSLMSIDIDQLIKDNMNKLDPIETVLVNTSQALPQSSHTLYSIIQFISSVRATAAMVDYGKTVNAELTMTDLRERAHALIDAVLVSIQDLKKANSTVNPAKSEEDDDNEDMPQNFICFQSEKQATLVSALHLESASRRCVELLTTAHVLVSREQDNDVVCEISRLLQEVYPFLQQYMLVVQHTLARMLIHHKSMAKFTYCLVNTFSIIITKGFCMPEGAEDAEEGDAEGTQAGTGIGEGEGTKDVSHEIEDEEQVLGTQNEERSNDDKQDTKEEKEGMDMENDFDGNLEDVEQEEQDNEESESSEDEDEEPDEQIGDVDDMDPDAVDDKMWGDEQDENLNESDKTVDDQGKQETKKDSDIVAKEESEEQSESKNEKSEAPENQDDQQQEQDNNEEQGDEGDEGDADEEREAEGEDEDDVENRPGEQLNAEIPEAETLDLPEDLNMEGDDEDQEEGGEDDMGMNDPMDIDELPNQEQLPEEEEGEAFHDALDHVDEGKEGEEGEEDENMPDGDQMDHTEEKKEGEEDEALPDNEQMDQENSKTSNAQIEEEEESEQTESAAQNREQPNSDATADNQFGVQGQAGKQSKSTSGKNDGEEDLADTAQGEDDNAEKKESKGKSGSGSNDVNNEEDETEDHAEDSEANEAQSNPQRSLGDALEKWRRRLENVEEAGTEEEETDEIMKTEDEDTENIQVNEKDTFEYVKNDEEAHDMQTMGNAQPDQVQDLKAAAMDEEQEDDAGVSGEMEVDQQEESIDTMPLPRETLDMSGAADRQGAILSKRLPENQIVDETEILTVDESVVSREPLEKQDIEHMRDELEAQVSEWREEGRDINKARELWQGYENLTHDLAMGLCEQLRLILEPTLATKLKGDYRTGKRLNMKKIIPYIASQFKKDKIWLRRTKLSKRQYQVMISVDDSKSMSESRSVQLAYETLALISKALSQLEVGDISISSFGERVRLLHPFGQPFTSESGANVIQQFTFAQQKTYVKNLIETSLGLFENAKYSSGSGAAELWQLQLIISDGICEDHETLRALVRSALEQRIMIIFIVVDNKPEKDSILNMTNITYTIKDGKYGIQMKPYLETFPFQYFMIVRDVSSLPEALSDALRQYFSFVSS